MTAKIQSIYQHPAIRRDIAEAMLKCSQAITEAINEADAAGVPLILLGTILHAQSQLNTTMMMECEDGEE